MVRVLVDEHIESGLTVRGGSPFEIEYVIDVLSPGVDDAEIVKFARSHHCLILTNDQGFLQLDLSDAETGILYLPNQREDPLTIGHILNSIEQHCESVDVLFGQRTYLTRDWI